MIQTLEIQNFKSIRHLQMDCRRVNLFIGEPNTGKSNILEALGLFSIPHTWEIQDFVRMESMDDLFYEHDISQRVMVRYDGGESSEISLVADQETFPPQFLLLSPWGLRVYRSDGSIVKIESPVAEAPPLKIRFYRFSPGVVFGGQPAPFLLPPRGENLPQVLLTRKDLHRMASGFFKRFGLTLLVSLRRDKLEMMREREGEFITFPYSLASDTLQRQIFHLIAMETSQDAVLIFEEPEAHAFPLYTKYLAERVALDESNQYFISTHNPYFLIPLVEKIHRTGIRVFVTYLWDGQTRVHPLAEEELRELLDLESGLFFNLSLFVERLQRE